MGKFEEAYSQLNAAQKRAVDQIDGPVLVIAGPGTGKTQLLTTRIANILDKTDASAANILCLTFTESAAQTMRDRLSSFIGQDAYDVTISTYHAFGSDLIRRYPDYFAELGDTQAVDDLGIDTILREIVAELPYSNPLKFSDNYLGDIKSLVSDAKRALLTPDDLRAVAKQNATYIKKASPIIAETLGAIVRLSKKDIPAFVTLGEQLAPLVTNKNVVGDAMPLGNLLFADLEAALAETAELGSQTPLTKWKNAWLAKDETGKFVVDGERACRKLSAAADIYEAYLQELQARGLFDFDDMILRAVHALQTHADLRYTLQEQYQYILLDEFQDTNGAQLRLVELLTDNPVNEGRPNVLAVGDDDQAIYAFQGANYSHMLQFQQMYRNVLLVPLTKNYRSHKDILHVARGIAEQIEERLHHHFPEIEKTLEAENTKLPAKAIIERREAKSDVSQFAWVAARIHKLIQSGTPASEIAVLAPQHKYLEPLVAFLRQEKVPVRYEKRENILDDPAINQLLRMSELCLALTGSNQAASNSLWAEVLSFEFWDIPTSVIWQLSWQANDQDQSWTDMLLQNPELKPLALFFIRLSMLSKTETVETLLDYLIGIQPLDLQEPNHEAHRSPFYAFYFGDIHQTENGGEFWNLLTNLIVLRARLREYKADELEPLKLADLIAFVSAHRAANIKILNTSPYQEAAEAVQLMTAFKAKGQEYAAVFVLAVNDEAWSNKARGQGNRLSIPANLQFIRYAGATNDERLRLFYVAITRAKSQLYLVNYTNNYAGKTLARLKYLSETTDESGMVVSPLLPASYQNIEAVGDPSVAPTTELAAYWQQRHESALNRKDVINLLRARLDKFQLSPTHVGDFTDLANCGPQAFFLKTILRFPQAPSPQIQFGNAMHETLEWIHRFNKREGQLPDQKLLATAFEKRLRTKKLSEQQTKLLLSRGHDSLHAYLSQRGSTVSADNECEYNFRGEGVFVGKAHVGGKIDKLIINKANKTITIVDYKTGKAHHRWDREVKLHKYQQQLYFYKLLVEGSNRFAGYTVIDGYVEFVEPDEQGKIVELHIAFDDQQSARLKRLIEIVWQQITTLKLPDSSEFSADLTGVIAFEKFLLGED